MSTLLSHHLAELRKTFPGVALSSLDSLSHVVNVLLPHAGPNNPLTRVAVAQHSILSDASGKASASLKLFDQMQAQGAHWLDMDLASIRLLIHVNRPSVALERCRILPSNLPQRAGLEALATLGAIPASSTNGFPSSNSSKSAVLEIFEKNVLTLDQDGLINVANLAEEVRGSKAALPLWESALQKHPANAAALFGNGKIDRILDLPVHTAEDKARRAQALIFLASAARREQRAVTAEGLLRNALKFIEEVKGVKPIYTSVLQDGLLEYAMVLKSWDKREGEAQSFEEKAKSVRVGSGLPSFKYQLEGWAIARVEP